jgi:hypothetical protein
MEGGPSGATYEAFTNYDSPGRLTGLSSDEPASRRRPGLAALPATLSPGSPPFMSCKPSLAFLLFFPRRIPVSSGWGVHT